MLLYCSIKFLDSRIPSIKGISAYVGEGREKHVATIDAQKVDGQSELVRESI
jgi:hypothetical protein